MSTGAKQRRKSQPKKEQPASLEYDPVNVPRYNLQRRKIFLELQGLDGVFRRHYLLQLDGKGRDEFNAFQDERFTRKEDGTSGPIKNFEDLYHWLIAKMLHLAETNKLVPIDEIRQYPDDVVEELYDLALHVSDLTKDAMIEAKND